jgi:hypothetical protein
MQFAQACLASESTMLWHCDDRHPAARTSSPPIRVGLQRVFFMGFIGFVLLERVVCTRGARR